MGTILVTGASRGLGREVARELVRAGHKVFAGVRDASRGAQAARETGAELAVLDVSAPASIAALSLPPLDVLVNNAAINEGTPREIWDTNVRGPMLLTRKLAPHMPAGGRVVMVSSGMGTLGSQGASLQEKLAAPSWEAIDALLAHPEGRYSASKAALNAMTKLFAAEFPALRINAVCPGWVRTDMGGASAPRSLAQGTASILWGCNVPADGPTGGFFRDGQPVPF